MTIHQAVKLLNEKHLDDLSKGEIEFIEKILDGLDGLGEVSDRVANEYLTPGQVNYVRILERKFLGGGRG